MKKGLREPFPLSWNVIMETRKKDGTVIDREKVHNDVVNSGKYNVGDYLGGLASGLAGFTYIAIGESESGDSVVAGDTALKSEATRALATINRTGNVVTFEKTFSFGSGESYAIAETGLFDSASESGSVMFNRAVLASVKNVDDETDLYVKITITVG